MKCLYVANTISRTDILLQDRNQKENSFHFFEKGSLKDDSEYGFKLRSCGASSSLVEGKWLHAGIIKSGLSQSLNLGIDLINMYGKCGNVAEAENVFDRMCEREVVSWTGLIATYGQNDRWEEVFKLYQMMQLDRVPPNNFTFVAILAVCSNLGCISHGKLIHACVMGRGIRLDAFVGTAVATMYIKCKNLKDAHMAFETIHGKNLVSWTAMIGAFAEEGCGRYAFQLFHQMQEQGISPNKVTLLNILDACANSCTLSEGKMIHALAISRQFEGDIMMESKLISMYENCMSLMDAQMVFDRLDKINVVSWTVMIKAYVHHGHGMFALNLFHEIGREGIVLNNVSFLTILGVCASPSGLPHGKLLHAQYNKGSMELDVVLGTALIDMYGKCSDLEGASMVFSIVNQLNVVSWTAMIAACVQDGHGTGAFEIFRMMQQQQVNPNEITFVNMIDASSSLSHLAAGKVIHGHILVKGYESNLYIGNALVNMYSKCGSLPDAFKVFYNMQECCIVSWTAIITACALHEHGVHAIHLFKLMRNEHIEANEITFVSLLDACSSLGAIGQGKFVHASVIDRSVDNMLVGSALIRMYARCGSLEGAKLAFNNVFERNLVLWTTMIAGFAENGCDKEALQLFAHMEREKMNPDKVTLISILDICARMATLEKGRYIWGLVVDNGADLDIIVLNAVITMYGKCGKLEEACIEFKQSARRDLILWNTIIGICAQHGIIKEVLRLFQHMQQESIKADNVTFLNVLSACSHAGTLDEGCYFFISMPNLEIQQTMDHYACFIDLLGRATKLDEAHDFVESMPIDPSTMAWMSMLLACTINNDAQRAKYAAEQLLKLDIALHISRNKIIEMSCA